MNSKAASETAQSLYEQGKLYNWREGATPENVLISRALLQQAAELGHARALSELAEMVFSGVGGEKDQVHALRLKLAAFNQGDVEALEGLSALLGSYAEHLPDSYTKQRVSRCAIKAEEADERLQYIRSFVGSLERPNIEK